MSFGLLALDLRRPLPLASLLPSSSFVRRKDKKYVSFALVELLQATDHRTNEPHARLFATPPFLYFSTPNKVIFNVSSKMKCYEDGAVAASSERPCMS
eukprot:scaffold21743_cov144-Skeletonema_dohrnii-CCMP3373.AAC.7